MLGSLEARRAIHASPAFLDGCVCDSMPMFVHLRVSMTPRMDISLILQEQRMDGGLRVPADALLLELQCTGVDGVADPVP